MREIVPPHVAPLLNRLNETVADVRNALARSEHLELAPPRPPDPKVLEETARRPDAPKPLKDLLKAVSEGRTTWADVASGRALHLPEVRDLVTTARVGEAARQYEQADDQTRESAARRDAEAEIAARDWAEQQVARRAADARRDEEPVFTSVFEEPAPRAPSTTRPRRPSGDDDDEDYSEHSYLDR